MTAAPATRASFGGFRISLKSLSEFAVPAAVLAIVLATLGFSGRDQALEQELRRDPALDAAIKSSGAALTAHRYGLAALEFERLLRVMVLPRTVAVLSARRGADAQRRLYRALAVRFVPFIGWSYLTAELLASVYLNRDSTAPVLR